MPKNPFIDQLDQMEEVLVRLASDKHTIGVVDALPKEGNDRLKAVRALSPDVLTDGKSNTYPGLRVSLRWFEAEHPSADKDEGRYVIKNYPPEGGGGSPFLPPTKGSYKPSVCVSVGVIVCGSVGR